MPVLGGNMWKVLGLALLVGTLVPSVVSNKRPELCLTAVNNLADAINRASNILLRRLMVPNQTVIESAALSLLLVCQSAIHTREGSDSHRELLNLLNLSNNEEARCACNTVINLIAQKKPNDETAYASPSVGVYADKKYHITPGFKKDLKFVAMGEADNLDFEEPDKAARRINRQVERDTDKAINYLISGRSINDSLQLIYTTALNFVSPLDGFENSNNEGYFDVTPCTRVRTQYINTTQELDYVESEELDAKAVLIPYPGTSFSCLTILPNSNCNIKTVLRRMERRGALSDLLRSMRRENVTVAFPRLDTSTIENSKENLQQTNLISMLYDSDTSEFVDTIKDDIPVEISIGIQRVVATNIAKGNRRRRGPRIRATKEFIGNRPHFYKILADEVPFITSYIGNPRNQYNNFFK